MLTEWLQTVEQEKLAFCGASERFCVFQKATPRAVFVGTGFRQEGVLFLVQNAPGFGGICATIRN